MFASVSRNQAINKEVSSQEGEIAIRLRNHINTQHLAFSYHTLQYFFVYVQSVDYIITNTHY